MTLTQESLNAAGTAWELLLDDNFDRYDENGKEYTYKVTELSTSDGRSWSIDDQTRISVEGSEGNLDIQSSWNFSNSLGPNENLIFEAEKEWLDDNDLLSRKEVTLGLFRKDAASGEWSEDPVETVTLNESNGWRVRFSVPKQDDTDTVDNYLLKEVKVDEVSAIYETSEDEIKSVVTASGGGKVGILAEDESFFNWVASLLAAAPIN